MLLRYAYIIALAFMITLLVNQSISTLYRAPEEPEYPSIEEPQYPPDIKLNPEAYDSPSLSAESRTGSLSATPDSSRIAVRQEAIRQINETYAQEQQAYEESMAEYDKLDKTYMERSEKHTEYSTMLTISVAAVLIFVGLILLRRVRLISESSVLSGGLLLYSMNSFSVGFYPGESSSLLSLFVYFIAFLLILIAGYFGLIRSQQ